MTPEREELQQEIARLQDRLAAQEQRIAALESEAEEFRQIEAQLLQAISRANAGFRAMVRAAHTKTPR